MFSKTTSRPPSRRLAHALVALVALVAALTALTAVALTASTPLEVDGNAIDVLGGGEDWDVNNPVIKRDHVRGEAGPEDAYIQGGSKDERDISSAGSTSQYWRYGDASVPDKDDLVHVFAKEYPVPNSTNKLLYFGATRASNDGDSAIGFWFLKKDIRLGSAPSFIGVHTDGDILITGDFGKGGGSSVINVFVWENGRLRSVISSNAGLKPNDVAPAVFCSANEGACASANKVPEMIPANMANYVFKTGGANVYPADGKFPVGTFLEGGIDLGALGLPTETCFSTVLAMTRSASSTDAQLKDFVIEPFGGCGVEITKACKTSDVDVTGEFITSTYDVTLKAVGGTITGVQFQEDIDLAFGTNADATPAGFPRCKRTDTGKWLDDDVDTPVVASLSANQIRTVPISCDHTTEQLFNNVSASASDGVSILTDSFTMATTCELATTFTPAIQVQKSCDTVKLVVDGNTVQPQVCNRITVTNNSNEALANIVLYDNPDGDGINSPAVQVTAGSLPPSTAVPTTLAIGRSFEVVHCYIPSTTTGGETNVEAAAFLNLAMVTATGVLSRTDVDDEGSAQCYFCPGP